MKISVLFILYLAVVQATSLTPDPDDYLFDNGDIDSEESINPVQGGISESVLEVAVVCDTSCRSRFRNDTDAIHHYVINLFRHLQWTFQTDLPTVPLSFRVTSVTIKDSEIPINYGVSMTIGDLVVKPQEDIGTNFAKWMYKIRKGFPTFDIAMLITDNWPFPLIMRRSACMVNDEDQVVGSMVHSLSTRNPGISLASQLASTLGSGHNLMSPSPLCQLLKVNCNFDFPYSPSLLSGLTEGPFNLPLSNEAENIINFVSSEDASCLQTTDWDKAPFLDSSTAPFRSENDVSMEQQCELLFTLEEGATLEVTGSTCKELVCKMVTKSDAFIVGVTKNLSPLDGTKCEHDGRCFRGECIKPPAIQIVSATRGHCVESKGSSGDPQLGHCSSSKTPLNTFAIQKIGDNFLLKAYLTGTGSVNQCLWVNSETLEYADCNNDDEELQWTALELKDESYLGDFVLFHLDSKRCLLAGETSLETTSDCSTPSGIFWRFLDEHGLVRNMSGTFQKEPEQPHESSSKKPSTFNVDTIFCSWWYVMLVLVLVLINHRYESNSSNGK